MGPSGCPWSVVRGPLPDGFQRLNDIPALQPCWQRITDHGPTYFLTTLPRNRTSVQSPVSSNVPTPTWPQVNVVSVAVIAGVFMSSKYTSILPDFASRTTRMWCQVSSFHGVPGVVFVEIFTRSAPLTMKIWLAWSS